MDDYYIVTYPSGKTPSLNTEATICCRSIDGYVELAKGRYGVLVNMARNLNNQFKLDHQERPNG